MANGGTLWEQYFETGFCRLETGVSARFAKLPLALAGGDPYISRLCFRGYSDQ